MGFRALVERGLAAAGAATPSGERPRRAIAAALIAYAAGDAFGVPYEFQDPPIPVDPTCLGSLDGWPPGGVSDDTTLTLLTVAALPAAGPDSRYLAAAAAAFRQQLRAAAPELRGLGPTTRAALGMDVPADQAGLVGTTNGALMRTALLGLAFRPDDDGIRRALVRALAEVTHPAPAAVACAVLASAVFSRLPDGLPRSGLFELLRAEVQQWDDVPAEVAELLAGWPQWRPPVGGVSLSPIETLAAVLTVAARADTCLAAYRDACELGGDTDTVSALSAAVVAAGDPDGCELFDIAWLDQVCWHEVPHLADAIATLVVRRERGAA